MPDIGPLGSLAVDEVFILPRSGFVQQIVKVRSGAARLHRTQNGCALLGRLTKTLCEFASYLSYNYNVVYEGYRI